MTWRFWLSDKTVRKFEELPIHCQRQNCSPEILVSSKVRFIWIFAGVAGEKASNECGVVVNGDFRSLYLPNFHIHGHSYYIELCSPLVAYSSHSGVKSRGVARNLFRRGTKQGEWEQKSPSAGPGAEPWWGSWAKAPEAEDI